MKLIDLGWCMGRLKERDARSGETLIIISPSSAEESTFQPAESVTIWGLAALLNLRDALNEAYPLDNAIADGKAAFELSKELRCRAVKAERENQRLLRLIELKEIELP